MYEKKYDWSDVCISILNDLKQTMNEFLKQTAQYMKRSHF